MMINPSAHVLRSSLVLNAFNLASKLFVSANAYRNSVTSPAKAETGTSDNCKTLNYHTPQQTGDNSGNCINTHVKSRGLHDENVFWFARRRSE